MLLQSNQERQTCNSRVGRRTWFLEGQASVNENGATYSMGIDAPYGRRVRWQPRGQGRCAVEFWKKFWKDGEKIMGVLDGFDWG